MTQKDLSALSVEKLTEADQRLRQKAYQLEERKQKAWETHIAPVKAAQRENNAERSRLDAAIKARRKVDLMSDEERAVMANLLKEA